MDETATELVIIVDMDRHPSSFRQVHIVTSQHKAQFLIKTQERNDFLATPFRKVKKVTYPLLTEWKFLILDLMEFYYFEMLI